jgi:hypothetical protein
MSDYRVLVCAKIYFTTVLQKLPCLACKQVRAAGT